MHAKINVRIHSHSRCICFHDHKFMKLDRLKENFPSKNIKVKTKTKDAAFSWGQRIHYYLDNYRLVLT